jgi:hypothetical protein
MDRLKTRLDILQRVAESDCYCDGDERCFRCKCAGLLNSVSLDVDSFCLNNTEKLVTYLVACKFI